MESKFLKIDDEKQWQDLLAKALFKTFFHQPEWEEFLESQFKWLKFEHYNYQDRALLSLARVNGKKLISHPFCEYGGPLPLTVWINFTQFKEDLLKQFKQPLKISFHPEISLGPLQPSKQYFSDDIKNSIRERHNYFVRGFVDSDPGIIWQGFRKSTRQEIEKAQNEGLTIEKCKNKKELKEFHKLHLTKARQHKIPAYSYSFFKYFFDNPKAEIILAKFKSRIVAGSIFLFYEQYIHYFLNASNFEGAQKRANYLILWEQIKKYCGKGKVFDLGGTRKESPLTTFKEGLGERLYREGIPLEIYEIKNFVENKEEKFSFARKIWGILPLFLIKKLSPYLLKYKI